MARIDACFHRLQPTSALGQAVTTTSANFDNRKLHERTVCTTWISPSQISRLMPPITKTAGPHPLDLRQRGKNSHPLHVLRRSSHSSAGLRRIWAIHDFINVAPAGLSLHARDTPTMLDEHVISEDANTRVRAEKGEFIHVGSDGLFRAYWPAPRGHDPRRALLVSARNKLGDKLFSFVS